jgi:membrane-anchored protein YejM (alkaline phosphatase superfamily)
VLRTVVKFRPGRSLILAQPWQKVESQEGDAGSGSWPMLDFCVPMRFFQWVLLLVFLTQWAGTATVPRSKSAPNIILITLDTTRADRMGFLGSPRGLTPNLDALAKQSVVFSRAYAHVPLTTPSHASIFTGTYPQFNHLNYLG